MASPYHHPVIHVLRRRVADIDGPVAIGLAALLVAEQDQVGEDEVDLRLRLVDPGHLLEVAALPEIVGIEEGDHFAGGKLQALPEGSELATVLAEMHENPRVAAVAGRQPLGRAVGGAVVHDDDLARRPGLGKHAVDCIDDVRSIIVVGI